MKKRFWTEEEKAEVIRMYPDYYAQEIADKLDRSLKSIYDVAKKLGLKKSPEFMAAEKIRQGERLKAVGVKNRFVKGQVPPNKGQKMPAELKEKVKHTWFKKGHTPGNTKYDGHTRITDDGYIMIRVSEGVYRLSHLINWEKVNGKLPKGHCLYCKDGNRQNTEPANWELISRAENMKRNSIMRFPPEVRSTIKMVSKLKRKIEKHEKQD